VRRDVFLHSRYRATRDIDYAERTRQAAQVRRGALERESGALTWFLAFNASIAIHSVMVPANLAKAGSAIEAAANKYR
jgi:hypothetical protein